MKNRDWYLEQLGISQYILRKPTALSGESAIILTNEIRLIAVTALSPTEAIFVDILKAIHLDIAQVLIIQPEKVIMLPNELEQVIWFIDYSAPIPSAKWPAVIQTESLAKLANSPTDKRQLWQRLCQYDHYFQTHSE